MSRISSLQDFNLHDAIVWKNVFTCACLSRKMCENTIDKLRKTCLYYYRLIREVGDLIETQCHTKI